jgi:hypothetical protein
MPTPWPFPNPTPMPTPWPFPNPTPMPTPLPFPNPTPMPTLRSSQTLTLAPETYRIYQNNSMCIDLVGQENESPVWYCPCDLDKPGQFWMRYNPDNDGFYMRSEINTNKCLVGTGGSAEQGTRLVISDCIIPDDRFKWDWYDDDSIRPRNNNAVCIEPDTYTEGSGDGQYLMLDGCYDDYKSWIWEGN